MDDSDDVDEYEYDDYRRCVCGLMILMCTYEENEKESEDSSWATAYGSFNRDQCVTHHKLIGYGYTQTPLGYVEM